jgi:hypothetical protein
LKLQTRLSDLGWVRSGDLHVCQTQKKKFIEKLTAIHAAIAPHKKPSAVDKGFCVLVGEAFVDMSTEWESKVERSEFLPQLQVTTSVRVFEYSEQ